MLQAVVTPTSLGDLRKVLKQAPKATLMAGGTLVMPIVNGGAHGITATEPDRINADLLQFLKKGHKTSRAA